MLHLLHKLEPIAPRSVWNLADEIDQLRVQVGNLVLAQLDCRHGATRRGWERREGREKEGERAQEAVRDAAKW